MHAHSTVGSTEEIPCHGAITMILFGLCVGIIGGFGAVIFRKMISFFHNLLFYGTLNLHYDANIHSLPSVWGIGIILVPVVGAFGVAWLVQTFAPEAKGHGVPEVIDAVYYQDGKIRPMVAFFKSIASALSIGSGGAVGREGPIIQIGAAFGSTLGQVIRMPLRQRVTLIAAGAGAGIAATFNAPIGGVAFAVELLLVSVNASTLAVVSIATVTAAYIGRAFLGMSPAFDIPELTIPSFELTGLFSLVLFIPFGILIGLASEAFIRMIYGFEDFFESLPMSYYFRHALGMLILGVMMYLFLIKTGHYYIQGVGYATIVDVLKSVLSDPWFLLLLCVMKLIATSLTLGSGASGGVFSPGLFMGATLGCAFGYFILAFFPGAGFDPIMFAVAGMAGMIAGTTGAVLTSITMLFEMTRDYSAVLPIIVTAAIAYITRMLMSNESIYTLKLLRRGHVVHEGLQAAVSSAQQASHLMNPLVDVVDLSNYDSATVDKALKEDRRIIVKRGDKLLGLLKEGACLAHEEQMLLHEGYFWVDEDQSFLEVLRVMRKRHCQIAFVRAKASDAQVIGVITPKEVTNFSSRAAELMNESV